MRWLVIVLLLLLVGATSIAELVPGLVIEAPEYIDLRDAQFQSLEVRLTDGVKEIRVVVEPRALSNSNGITVYVVSVDLGGEVYRLESLAKPVLSLAGTVLFINNTPIELSFEPSEARIDGGGLGGFIAYSGGSAIRPASMMGFVNGLKGLLGTLVRGGLLFIDFVKDVVVPSFGLVALIIEYTVKAIEYIKLYVVDQGYGKIALLILLVGELGAYLAAVPRRGLEAIVDYIELWLSRLERIYNFLLSIVNLILRIIDLIIPT